MVSSQPQPIQHNNHLRDANGDYAMSVGSYTGANGSFNPASYTRHYLGSPISWRAASFGSQLFPNGSPRVLNLDQNELKKMSSSLENDAGAHFFNALSTLDGAGESCRNYTCCGRQLTDLHALLEHFEEVHIVMVDNEPTQTQLQVPFNPQPLQTPTPMATPPHTHATATTADASQVAVGAQSHGSAQQQQSEHAGGPFDPDDMDIELDGSTHGSQNQSNVNGSASSVAPSSAASSPPDTPIVTSPMTQHAFPLSVHPNHAFAANAYHSQPPSPSPFDSSTLLRPMSAFGGAGGMNGVSQREVFNNYAGYADYSAQLPGAASSSSIAGAMGDNQGQHGQGDCVPPALLFSTTQHGHGRSKADRNHSPLSSRDGSPSSGSPKSPSHLSSLLDSQKGTTSSPTSSNGPNSSSSKLASLTRPSTSLLLSKPFRCPKPNCNKSYKQANGLKYHITHGSCNFAPAREMEQVQAIIAQRQQTNSAANSTPGSPSSAHISLDNGGAMGTGLTEKELREVEREAERQLRPFACGVGECQRRYKNMNGLRYHYQHSGEHGALGLALLASGTHPCLAANRNNHMNNAERRANGGSKSSSLSRDSRRERGIVASRSSSVAGSRPATPPASAGIPSQGGFANVQQQHLQYSNQYSPQTSSFQQQNSTSYMDQQPTFEQQQQAGIFDQAYNQRYSGTTVAVPVQMGFVNGGSHMLGGDATMHG